MTTVHSIWSDDVLCEKMWTKKCVSRVYPVRSAEKDSFCVTACIVCPPLQIIIIGFVPASYLERERERELLVRRSPYDELDSLKGSYVSIGQRKGRVFTWVTALAFSSSSLMSLLFNRFSYVSFKCYQIFEYVEMRTQRLKGYCLKVHRRACSRYSIFVIVRYIIREFPISSFRSNF